MNILIAGIPGKTVNYECALSRCQIGFETDLYPADSSSFDKLLLPGGGDLHPSWFGQEDHGSGNVDRTLDRAQLALLHAFFLEGKPILGICRGLQLINVYLGGGLIQDLPTAKDHRFQEQDQIHTADCLPGSLLHRFYGSSCLVNSAHHQGCSQTGCGLVITQTAFDGVVEALEHQTRPVLGVQWHPERTALHERSADLADGLRLIHYFAEQM